VNENFYDPDFRGKDWKYIKRKYKSLIMNTTSDDEFFKQLNTMLFELESSHFAVGPISDVEEASSPYMFKEGSIGIDVRIIDKEVVVTKVVQDSPAENAGLKAGAVLEMIDGVPIDSMVSKAWLHPPFNDICERMSRTEEVLRDIYGKADSFVTIKYLDGGKLKEVTVKRKKRTGMTSLGNLFDIYLEVEERAINHNIGYIRFNAFQPDDPARIINTLDKAKTYKGLIIDLRGNNGGSVIAMQRIIGNLISERIHCFTLVGRGRMEEYYINPSSDGYSGEIVILVDEMSVSGAENMTQILKNESRANVVGTRTSGQLLWGEGSFINDSVFMVIPTSQLLYPDGGNLEGQGVIPDSVIQLSKKDLLNGMDSQLEAAIEIIEEQIFKSQ
jgi:C-terminal peptidase prc